MPTLDLKSAHEYWKNYQDPMIYRVVQAMESVEPWTLDGNPALENAINELGKAFDEVGKFTLGKESDFVQLIAYLKATRFLRILQAIDQIEPGSASRLLMYAEEQGFKKNEHASLFLKRNIVFERLRLMGRIFSPERFALILKALEGDMNA